jgi:hypothetical protein
MKSLFLGFSLFHSGGTQIATAQVSTHTDEIKRRTAS